MQHGVSDKPVMRCRVHLEQRIRPVADVKTIQASRDFSAHFQPGQGQLLSDRLVDTFQERVRTLRLLVFLVIGADGQHASGDGAADGRLHWTGHGGLLV